MSKQRKKQKRPLNTSIYIVCEGTNTEPIYFNAIAEQEDVVKEYRVTVYPSEEDQRRASTQGGEPIRTDAVNLVKIAKREREIHNYSEVWVVFDKDGYTKHKEAFLYAKRHDVNLAFSSIAFEHWILLHYEQNLTSFDKSQNVIDYLEEKRYFTGYSKKADISIYARLKGLTQTAIENAAWLRMEIANNLAACDDKIYELNPYTTVDDLVRKLLGFNPVTYGVINETRKISDISIRVNAVQHNCGIINLSVIILNHRNITYLVNNDSGHFYIRDEKQNKFQLALDNPMIIEPSLTQEIILKFQIFSATETLRFHFSPKPNEILIIALDNIT